MRLRSYLVETIKFSRDQKNNLCHVILNILMDPSAASMLKKLKKDSDNGMITVTKTEVETVLTNLKRIRQIIIDLPVEDGE
jgi:hypothetical protein